MDEEPLVEPFSSPTAGVERLMTNSRFSYTKSVALAELLDRRAVSHLTIRPYTPRTNARWSGSTRR
jgi:hypothetical protein